VDIEKLLASSYHESINRIIDFDLSNGKSRYTTTKKDVDFYLAHLDRVNIGIW
jgi:hypothetical protein